MDDTQRQVLDFGVVLADVILKNPQTKTAAEDYGRLIAELGFVGANLRVHEVWASMADEFVRGLRALVTGKVA